MSMGIDLTTNCNTVLNHARTIAQEFSHQYVTTEHIFISLLDKSDNIKETFKIAKISIKDIRKILVKDIVENFDKKETKDQKPQYSPKVSKIITLAGIEAKKHDSPVIGTHHLLLGILNGAGIVPDILIRIGIDIDELQLIVWNQLDPDLDVQIEGEDLETVVASDPLPSQFSQKQNTPTKNKALSKFATELTELALKDKLDPLIGRSDEVDQLVQILLRRQKNNAMIIGDAGVGKTAIVEGLAKRIASNDVPERLVNKKIYAIDMGSVLAGTKYRGQFEERLKSIISALSEKKDSIAFIDEFHTVIGSGNSEGSLDACNILKPALSRGEITLIGATTYDEYKQHVETDAALTRRFQTVSIDEPTPDETIEILKGVKSRYEKHHNVKYTLESLKAIVSLSERYIVDRNFPDKAIDILDQAGARCRSGLLSSSAFDTDLEKEINRVEKLKNDLVKHKEFEEAAKYRLTQKSLEDEYENNFVLYEKQLKKKISIKRDNIEVLISQITDIPCERLDDNSLGRLKSMNSLLRKNVIGQNKAIDIIDGSIRRSRVGLSDEKSPIGTFLFLGPTGVGKTHLAKQLTEYLFGDEDKMIRLDMSEYMEAHSVSKLIGSPPGYIGYGEGGKLTEAVRRDPYSVILFDEIEKAHADVYNILLQLLDEGKLTDSDGTVVNFKNCIIILTSNIGASKIQKNNTMGFLGTEYNDVEDKIMMEVEKAFKPEFINRLDEIAVFNHLSKPDLAKIINHLLRDLKKRIRKRGITLTISKDVINFLIDEGYDEKYGARPLKRSIKNHLESKLADYIIDNNLTNKHKIYVDITNGTIKLSTNSTKECSSNSA